MSTTIFQATMPLSELRAGLKHVKPASERRSSFPLLAAVLFAVEDGQVTLTCTDLEAWLTWRCAGSVVSQSGPVAVNVTKLWGVVSKLKSENPVTIEAQSDGQMIVKYGRVVFKFAAFGASKWPATPQSQSQSAQEAVMPYADMVDALSSVRPFVSEDETRLNLSGVQFSEHKGTLRMVASNGHHLGLIDTDTAIELADHQIVPDTALALIPKTKDEVVRFSFYSQERAWALTSQDDEDGKDWYFAMRGEQWELTTHCVEGDFPDYTRVIPSMCEGTVEFEAGVMQESLTQMLTLTTERNRRGKFAIGEDGIAISVDTHDVGEAYVEPFGKQQGKPVTWCGNMRYVSKIVKALAGKNAALPLTFHYCDDLRPIKVSRPTGDAVAVLMPINL